MDLAMIIQSTLSTDGATRTGAEAQLKHMEAENKGLLAVMLAQNLANEQSEERVRTSAGLILKNLFGATTKDEARRSEMQQHWISLDLQSKNQIKQAILTTLGSSSRRAGGTAAQVVSTLALIELPMQQWSDLIQNLLNNVSAPSPNLKIASLETLGYICEDIDPDVIGDDSNKVLTAVIQGMRKEEPEIAVRFAATGALNNALVFMKRNFENEQERNFIMTTICEATVVATTDDISRQLKLKAFECLVTIADLYYDFLPNYMNALAQLTFASINDDDNETNSDIARMAIEFWCTICDEEIEREAEQEDAAANEVEPERKCLKIIHAAQGALVPLMLAKLPKMDDELMDEDDSIQASAGTCLTLIANVVKNDVVPSVLPFVQQHIVSTEWNLKASAILAFGFILEGPSDETLNGLVQTALPMLVTGLQDGADRVKDASAWTLSRTCEFHAAVLLPHMVNILPALVQALTAPPRVANNACWGIHFLALACLDEDEDTGADQDTNQLTQFFTPILQALLVCTEREDVSEANLRISSYEVIHTVIKAGAQDTIAITAQLIEGLLARLAKTLQMEIVTGEDKEEQLELQGLLCGVFTAIINKLGQSITPYAPRMMEHFLKVLQQPAATVHEEALMSVSAIAANIGADFQPYAASILPMLLQGLKNHEAFEVCTVAVGLVGDMCRALQKQFLPFANEVLQALLTNLQNPALDNSVKPPILSTFGDIAMALQEQFEPYLMHVMYMLYQASTLEVDPNDEDMLEYRGELREAILEAYVGVVQGLQDGNKAIALLPYLDGVFNLLVVVAQDESKGGELLRTAAALVGDTVNALPDQCKKYLEHQAIVQLVNDAKAEGLDEGAYAHEVIQKHLRRN